MTTSTTARKPSKARQDSEALARTVNRGVTLAAIIHTAAEDGPAVSDALYRAAAKVARMTPVERWVASTPPKVREAIAGA